MSTETKIVINPTPGLKYDYLDSIKGFLTNNMVTILFVVLCIIGFRLSGMNSFLYINDMISRITRNKFLVLALIIPVMAGMGLNFAIVIGAMAAQSAIIMVTHWGVTGIWGVALCVALSTPQAIIFGWLTGKLLNKARGQEMITSLFAGYFANGLYQLVFIQLVGKAIPMKNEVLLLSTGVGLRATINLDGGIRYGLDDFYRLSVTNFALFAAVFLILYMGWQLHKSKRNLQDYLKFGLWSGTGIAGIIWSLTVSGNKMNLVNNLTVPIFSWLCVLALCFFINYFIKTKMGQDMRSVGQDRHVATVAGIHSDRTRVMAIIMSTVLAAWGQVIFLQNLGSFTTFGAHSQIGLYSTAALLIGGATITKATTGQALLGVLLFHTLFIVSPGAGSKLFGDPQLGEFFRVFVAFGVIGMSVAMHAWRVRLMSKRKISV
jgi:simple sugar transport system permease protein